MKLLMKLTYIIGVLSFVFSVVKAFRNPYGLQWGPEHAIGVVIIAGVGCWLFGNNTGADQ